MKKLLTVLLCAILFSVSASAQKMFTRNGHIWFYSTTPMEDIEAHNRQTTSVLDVSTGEMAFSMMIKGFKFEKALMEEHFNEKYLHSDKFPKSSFEGKITNYDKIDFTKDGIYNAKVVGKLTIHGVTKETEADGTFEVKGGKIFGKSKFLVLLSDYNITIPSVVRDNIAKVIEVNVDMLYEPMKKK
ncbi:MAG: YceI family protein [Bacteroidetes bacterium]|nr:YceI family protein [Bacteroidota bacterium]